MITVFMENYQPENVLHRDEQLKKLSETFEQFKQFGVGTNLIIKGVTGSGKTVLVKHMLKKYENQIYINCANFKTSLQILKEISGEKSNDFNLIITKVIEKIKIENKILVLDELNKVESTKDLFNDLNTIYRETGKPIILITNNVKFSQDMPDDARLTLFFHTILFNSYNRTELLEIVKSRVNLLPDNLKETISEQGINYICSICSEEGSARDVLDLTMKCILKQNFSQDFIDNLVKDKNRSEFEEFYKMMNAKERKFLNILVDLVTAHATITNSVLNRYLPDLSPSSISQLITTFEKDYALIWTERVNRGRAGGSFRIINMDGDILSKLVGVIE